jgi:hypothetical protein
MNDLDLLLEPASAVLLNLVIKGWPITQTAIALQREDIRDSSLHVAWSEENYKRINIAASSAGYSIEWEPGGPPYRAIAMTKIP